MSREFRVGGEPKQFSLVRFGLLPKPKAPTKKTYDPQPNNDQFINYNDTHPGQEITRTIYTQHRQQDRGRAIALRKDPKYSFINREAESVWHFKKVGKFRVVQYYQVLWNGMGTPSGGKTLGSTYSNGFDYYADNIYQYTVQNYH